MILQHRLEIAAPAATVWEVVTDLPRYGEWNPFVVACESTLAVGDPITMRVRVLPFFAQPQRETMLRHEPGRLFCYGLPGGPLRSLASSRSHEVAPEGPERAVYTSHFELEGWLEPVVRGLLGRRLAWGFGAMSEAIRERAEALHARARPGA